MVTVDEMWLEGTSRLGELETRLERRSVTLGLMVSMVWREEVVSSPSSVLVPSFLFFFLRDGDKKAASMVCRVVE